MRIAASAAVLLVLLVLPAVAAAAPATGGSSFLVSVDAALHVLPDRGEASFPFWVNATCAGSPPPVGEVRLSFAAPTWTNVTIAPRSAAFVATDCATGGAPSRSGLVSVAQTPDARAYDVGAFVLTGTLDAAGAAARESSSDAARVKASFSGGVDVRANATRVAADAGSGVAAFDVRVTNLANGEVLVRWAPESRSSGLSFDVVPDVALGTRLNASGSPSWHDYRIVLRSSDREKDASVTFAVSGLDPYSGSGAPPARVTLTVAPASGARGVPGAGVAVVVVLALGVVVARARTRVR